MPSTRSLVGPIKIAGEAMKIRSTASLPPTECSVLTCTSATALGHINQCQPRRTYSPVVTKQPQISHRNAASLVSAYSSNPFSSRKPINTRSLFEPEIHYRALSVPPSQTFASSNCQRRHYATQPSEPSSTHEPPKTTESLARTPLYDLHVEQGAKFSPFAGFEMPLYYQDLNHSESHHWVREKCGLFDVSHMVQNSLHGPGAEAFLMQITPSALNELPEHHSTLSCLLDENGGIIDDTVITRLGPDSFYFVTNAGCRETDAAYLKAELRKFSEKDARGLNWESFDGYGLIALQGPKAAEVLQKFCPETDLKTLTFSQCRSISLTLPDGTKTPELLVSRTGYTGEDGFEISIPVDEHDPATTSLPTIVTKALLSDTSTVRLAGLAARDSLRLEAGMCLYGHDISIETTPVEAALGWVVSKPRRDPSISFNGSQTIQHQLSHPKQMGRRRVGLEVEKGPPAREGAEIIDAESSENKAIGVVTSGLPSPTLGGKNIAMALVDNGYHKKGTKLKVKIRKNVKGAEVVKMPFMENKFYRG